MWQTFYDLQHIFSHQMTQMSMCFHFIQIPDLWWVLPDSCSHLFSFCIQSLHPPNLGSDLSPHRNTLQRCDWREVDKVPVTRMKTFDVCVIVQKYWLSFSFCVHCFDQLEVLNICVSWCVAKALNILHLSRTEDKITSGVGSASHTNGSCSSHFWTTNISMLTAFITQRPLTWRKGSTGSKTFLR